MTIEAFWSKPPDYGRNRELDPLALSTVHEAAADVLLPFLSGRTRQAKDFLWVLLGLRWAEEQASTDREIWDYFERFEKALKLYWYDQGRHTGFTGVTAVRSHYEVGRTDFRFKLIENQSSQGLLGAYRRSLRDAGFVQRRSLRLDEPGRLLISGVQFSWSGEIKSYGWLARSFGRAYERFTQNVLRDLGAGLFDAPSMCDSAAAIRSLGGRPAWRLAASDLPSSIGKQHVAAIGGDLARFFRRVTGSFWTLLDSPDSSIAPIRIGHLRTSGWRDAVFSSASLRALREPFDGFLTDVPRTPKRALVQLHAAIWTRRGHLAPWIREGKGGPQVRPDIAVKAPPAEGEWDLRWAVAHELIRQTRWSPK